MAVPFANSRSAWLLRSLRWGVRVGAIALLAVGAGDRALAQLPFLDQLPIFDIFNRPPVDEFPPSPLELLAPDPLLPEFPMKRELSPTERDRLRLALDELNLQAAATLRAGKTLEAFALWNRELRLRRFLGVFEELPALGRVGELAWREGAVEETRIITDRLKAIQAGQTGPKPNLPEEQPLPIPTEPALLEALGATYYQVRAPKLALGVLEPRLQMAREANDSAAIEKMLGAIALLRTNLFDDGPATEAYRELLAIERAKIAAGRWVVVPTPPGTEPTIPLHRQAEVRYLKELAVLFDRSRQWDDAIATKRDLLGVYQELGIIRLIPPLMSDLAATFDRANRVDEAVFQYREAAAAARTIKQLGIVRESLDRLATLYRTRPAFADKPDLLASTYISLLELAREAADGYGMMDTYEKLGDLFVGLGQRDRARIAYEQAVILAGQLQHRQSYFTRKLQDLDRANSQPTPQSSPSVDPGVDPDANSGANSGVNSSANSGANSEKPAIDPANVPKDSP